MGRAPCCDKANVKRGPWSQEEDFKLKDYIEKNGTVGNWIALPQKAGLKRCGKSCRLRWLNYLRPNIKHGEFSDEEDRIICTLFATIGSRWSIIAAQLPGRTDNDIKNYWNTKLKKKLISLVPPPTPTHHKSKPPTSAYLTPSSLAPLYRDCTPFFSYSSTPSNSISSDLWKWLPTSPSYSSSSLFQFQDGGSIRKENMLIFGTTEASCSSCDFSWNGTKEIKQDLSALHSCCYNDMSLLPTVFEENKKKFMLMTYHDNNYNNIMSNGSGQNVNQQYWTAKATDGFYGESSVATPMLDYDVEDFKQQLFSSSCTSNTRNNSFNFIGENKNYNYYY